MPIIQFNLMEGRSDGTKQELARRVCETVADVLDVAPQSVRILIHELGQNDFFVAGEVPAEFLSNGESRGVHYEKD